MITISANCGVYVLKLTFIKLYFRKIKHLIQSFIQGKQEGFLEVPNTIAQKTVPMPTSAPAKPVVASPAPMNLADRTA
jgi:TPP-dependent 2-oxoacid decarboxylase